MKVFFIFINRLILSVMGAFVFDRRFTLGLMAFLLFWMPAVSQTDAVPVDTIVVTDFDRIDPVYVSASMDAAKRREYLILKRRVIKTMPYAKMAAMKMKAMEDKLQTIQGRRERSKYVKQCEESIKKMYMDQLKNLTIGEGQVLMKLLHRETGKTSWGDYAELSGHRRSDLLAGLRQHLWTFVAHRIRSGLGLSD